MEAVLKEIECGREADVRAALANFNDKVCVVARSVCSRCTMEFQPHSQLPLQLIEKLGRSLGARLGFITFRSCKLDFTYTVSLSSRHVWYITECMLPANEGMYKHIHMHM